MKLKKHWLDQLTRLLSLVNLRPEESQRTLLMFAFYTTISVGLRWIERSTDAQLIDEHGSTYLPWIYITSAVISAALVFCYSLLQKIFSLRWVIVAIAPLMVVPLYLLSWGVQIPELKFGILFLLRLWADAIYIVNELNTGIAANQLFNIREIKRTYPLVSSGGLVAKAISGFSLPLLLSLGSSNVILIASVLIVFGASILLYLSYNYPKAFPDSPQIYVSETINKRRLIGSLKRYAWLLFAFFGLLQIIGWLIEFQYFTQVRSVYRGREIAKFLGVLDGIVGICALLTQWFVSSRALERLGVFITAGALPTTIIILLPGTVGLLSLFPSIAGYSFFIAAVIIQFLDELLRYTLVSSSGTLLFQAIPDKIRTDVQTSSGGVAETIATASAGIIILATLWLEKHSFFMSLNWVLVIETIIVAASCLGVVWILRSRYVDLLVLSAERGQLDTTDVDLKAFKQAVVKALQEKGSESDKHSCIELLAQIDPKGAKEVLAPLLGNLPFALQCQSLEVMLAGGTNPAYLKEIRPLLDTSTNPEVFALALRYVWLSEENQDTKQLEKYLQPRENSIIRATAAALLLRQGDSIQKAIATKTLGRMLTHKQEVERMNAVKALAEAVYLQALRIHIPNLLQDESLRLRCAVLEMIAATHLEEYYWALLNGLCYKSTRNTAMGALLRLENEAIPMLAKFATNIYKPEIARTYAWRTLGQIGTLEAMDTLWLHLETSWGATRDHILRTLLKIYKQPEIAPVVDLLHESKTVSLIKQELRFLGEIYSADIDLRRQQEIYTQDQLNQEIFLLGDLLQRALVDLETDVKERLLLLLKLLYPEQNIHAATLNIRSESIGNLARGLEILDHTLDLEQKSVLLNILDQRSPEEKLQILQEAGMAQYQKIVISERIRRLLLLGNLLSDWCLACCFHFAAATRIRLTIPQIMASLRHPTGFVREAALTYLSVASSRILLEILPQLQNDPHPLIAAQVQELINKYQVNSHNNSHSRIC